MPLRMALAGLGGGFAGAAIGVVVAYLALPPSDVRPLMAGAERLNILRLPDNGLAKTVEADAQIDAILHRVVDATPAIAYARVSIVHNGTMAPQNIHLLHFSTIASVPAPGWPPLAMPQNHPLAEVRDYVEPVFTKPTCVLVKTGDLRDPATKARLTAANVGVVLDCSIFSPNNEFPGEFLGMLYLNFRSMADLPADLWGIEQRAYQAAREIGRALVATGHGR